MKKILLVYWPEQGNVENVAKKFLNQFSNEQLDLFSVADVKPETLASYDYWIVGGSTSGSHVWKDADDSFRWWDFFKMLDGIDFSNKKIALFGLGDQILYPHHFVDGLSIMKEEFEKRNARIYGKWPINGYKFSDSEGFEGEYFFGLALDEDQQKELTETRITNWVSQLKKEFELE
ncbi:MAG: flavodoxin [Bacteroidales bacterium]|nr:flavodoxin [Bacteroidales bacterium]